MYFSYDRNILNHSSTDEMNRLCLLLCLCLLVCYCYCVIVMFSAILCYCCCYFVLVLFCVIVIFRRKMLHYKLLTHGKGDLGGNEVD